MNIIAEIERDFQDCRMALSLTLPSPLVLSAYLSDGEEKEKHRFRGDLLSYCAAGEGGGFAFPTLRATWKEGGRALAESN